jgi:hypothetical protein
MGPFTESMTRLCGEIVALRGARLTFVRDLGQNVADMKAEFRRAHADTRGLPRSPVDGLCLRRRHSEGRKAPSREDLADSP